MATLYTAGYQGHSIESFLGLLGAHQIERVLDVRQLPFSRKPDFSKRRFQAHLEAAGVAYTHLVELGTPKEIRDEVRRTKDYEAFFAQMRQIIDAQEGVLQTALDLALRERCLLLCFEADYTTCHRLTVGEALCERAGGALELAHLGASDG